jgi:hypothetical protein
VYFFVASARNAFPVGKMYAAMPEVGEGCDVAPAAPRPVRGYLRLSVIPSGSPFVNRQSLSIEIRSRGESAAIIAPLCSSTAATLAVNKIETLPNVVPVWFADFISFDLSRKKNAFSSKAEEAATAKTTEGIAPFRRDALGAYAIKR